jgi:hypothetical protein
MKTYPVHANLFISGILTVEVEDNGKKITVSLEHGPKFEDSCIVLDGAALKQEDAEHLAQYAIDKLMRIVLRGVNEQIREHSQRLTLIHAPEAKA